MDLRVTTHLSLRIWSKQVHVLAAAIRFIEIPIFGLGSVNLFSAPPYEINKRMRESAISLLQISSCPGNHIIVTLVHMTMIHFVIDPYGQAFLKIIESIPWSHMCSK